MALGVTDISGVSTSGADARWLTGTRTSRKLGSKSSGRGGNVTIWEVDVARGLWVDVMVVLVARSWLQEV